MRACLEIKKKEAFGFLCFERGLRASSFFGSRGYDQRWNRWERGREWKD
nr:MAG TPA: hypothetical protein [Bacteriophage sp.]